MIAQVEKVTNILTTLVSAFILSRLYCNSILYGSHEYLIEILQRVQNNAARMVLRVSRKDHIPPHLRSLHWLPVSARIEFKIASICYNCVQGNTPTYLKALVHPGDQYRYRYALLQTVLLFKTNQPTVRKQ